MFILEWNKKIAFNIKWNIPTIEYYTESIWII